MGTFETKKPRSFISTMRIVSVAGIIAGIPIGLFYLWITTPTLENLLSEAGYLFCTQEEQETIKTQMATECDVRIRIAYKNGDVVGYTLMNQ